MSIDSDYSGNNNNNNSDVTEPKEPEQPEGPEPSKAPAPNEPGKDEPAPAPASSKKPFDQDPPGFKNPDPKALVREDGTAVPSPATEPLEPEMTKEEYEKLKADFASDKDGPRPAASYQFKDAPKDEKAAPPSAEEEAELNSNGVTYRHGAYHRPTPPESGGQNEVFLRKDGSPMSKEEVKAYLDKERSTEGGHLANAKGYGD